MEFEKVVRKRAMIRKYKEKMVEDEKIQKILSLAWKAPSAGFTQPVEFIVVRDQKIKKQLYESALYQEQIINAPVVIVVVSDTRRSAARYGERGINFYSIIDGAFASMIILLACVNEGLGACFVGAFEDEKVQKVLNLPSYVRPIGIITIGYGDELPPKYRRIELKKVVHYDKW
jgi:nitroreductase